MNAKLSTKNVFYLWGLRLHVQELFDRVALQLGRKFDHLFAQKNAPRTSILIPTLPGRVELLIGRAIPSILAQGDQDFEVLIVTDAFSSEVDDVLKDLDPRFRYLWGARIPRSLSKADAASRWCSAATPALNLALKSLKGLYIARLDDDDSWDSDHLEKSVGALLAKGSEFVSSATVLPDNTQSPSYRADDPYYGPTSGSKHPPVKLGSPITWVYARHLRHIRYSPWSWRLQHNRPADINLSMRFWKAGAKMLYLERVGAYVGLRKNQTNWGLKAFLED
jgi:glycosyltransferase involved in cell wall biosynthesis